MFYLSFEKREGSVSYSFSCMGNPSVNKYRNKGQEEEMDLGEEDREGREEESGKGSRLCSVLAPAPEDR